MKIQEINNNLNSSALWLENASFIQDISALHDIAVQHDPDNFESKPADQILAQNYQFLMEHKRLTREEYFDIFQRCAKNNDYTELALIFNDTYYKVVSEEFAEDSNNEGAKFAMAGLEGAREGIQEFKEEGNKNPLGNIGSLAIQRASEWTLEMQNRDLGIKEVLAELEAEER